VITSIFYQIGDLIQIIGTSIAALVVLVCFRKLGCDPCEGRKNKEPKLLIFNAPIIRSIFCEL